MGHCSVPPGAPPASCSSQCHVVAWSWGLRPECNKPHSTAGKLHFKLLNFQLALQRKRLSAESVLGEKKNARAFRKNRDTLASFHGQDNPLNVREMAYYHTHLCAHCCHRLAGLLSQELALTQNTGSSVLLESMCQRDPCNWKQAPRFEKKIIKCLRTA